MPNSNVDPHWLVVMRIRIQRVQSCVKVTEQCHTKLNWKYKISFTLTFLQYFDFLKINRKLKYNFSFPCFRHFFTSWIWIHMLVFHKCGSGSPSLSPILAAAQPKSCRNLSPHTGHHPEGSTPAVLPVEQKNHLIIKDKLHTFVHCRFFLIIHYKFTDKHVLLLFLLILNNNMPTKTQIYLESTWSC